MKKYLVRRIEIGKPGTPFSNFSFTTFFGKDLRQCDNYGYVYQGEPEIDYRTVEYGYNRPEDAKKSRVFRIPEDKNWTYTVDIVEVEIPTRRNAR